MLGSLSKVLPRVEVPPEWGVDPVPPSERRMSFRQHFVLWFNLGIGLLVILTGGVARAAGGRPQAWAWRPGRRCWQSLSAV